MRETASRLLLLIRVSWIKKIHSVLKSYAWLHALVWGIEYSSTLYCDQHGTQKWDWTNIRWEAQRSVYYSNCNTCTNIFRSISRFFFQWNVIQIQTSIQLSYDHSSCTVLLLLSHTQLSPTAGTNSPDFTQRFTCHREHIPLPPSSAMLVLSISHPPPAEAWSTI